MTTTSHKPYAIKSPEVRAQIAELRFWPKVDKGEPDDCWEWTGARNADGQRYGIFWNGAKVMGAHRFAWTVTYGPIPDGALVLHRPGCASTCVNPRHLSLGGYADVVEAALRSGKRLPSYTHGGHAKGEDHGQAKLTADKVRKLRAEREAGATLQALGERYGVTSQTIWYAVHRKTWSHVS